MRTIILSLSGLLILFFSSCGQFIYKSPTAHTPLLTKRNDINAQLNLGGAGGEIYAAYSPINNVGVSAGYSQYSTSKDSINNSASRFHDIEFSAIPYYAKDRLRLEMPIGFGTTQKSSPDHTFATYTPYTRMFAQPAIGVSWDEFEMAFFCRVTSVDYSEKLLGTDMRYEPGFMLRGATKNIKAMMQFRLDYGTNYSKRPGSTLPIDQMAEYLPFHFSFGVSFNFNTDDLGKKEKK